MKVQLVSLGPVSADSIRTRQGHRGKQRFSQLESGKEEAIADKLMELTMSKDLVKVARERGERNGPIRKRFFSFFSPSTENQTWVTLPTPSAMYGFSASHFSLQSVLTQNKTKALPFVPRKSFKGINNISNCHLPSTIHSVLCASFGWGKGLRQGPR